MRSRCCITIYKCVFGFIRRFGGLDMAVVTFDAHHPFTSLFACAKGLLARIAKHRKQRREVRRLADVLCSMNG